MVSSINVVTSVKEQLHTVVQIIGEVYIVVLAPIIEDYGLPRIIVLVNTLPGSDDSPPV
jgi:predicted membrane-bound dolichyl-phosphate-mannose-protein mannosyltransferase